MMMEKNCWKSSLFLYGLMILAMVLTVYYKENYHVDELLSFTLSNNDTGWMHFEDGRKYNSEDLFESQFAAQTDRRFDYTTVWNNQAGDVHPPLYYAILHTICSLTPQRISKWQPAIINFIFALLTLYIQRRIWALFWPKVHTEKQSKLIQNITFGVWVLLPGVLNAIAFFRMYIMSMFMVTWVSYLCLKILLVNVSGGGQKLEAVDVSFWSFHMFGTHTLLLRNVFGSYRNSAYELFVHIYEMERNRNPDFSGSAFGSKCDQCFSGNVNACF